MTYGVGLIFDYLRIELGQRFDEALVVLLVFRRGTFLFVDLPIELDIADRNKAF